MARSHAAPTPRVAVVGSGFGGLAAAIRLQAAGCEVVLFEARDKPGGRAYVYQQDGFTFDAGPTVITAPDCLVELFLLAGRNLEDYVELLKVRPFYRLRWDDGDSFDYDSNIDACIAARSPQDAEGYRRFLAYSKRVFDTGYVQLAATPFLSFRDMLRVAPKLVALRADRSVYSTVSRFVRDEKLRQALSFHALLVGGNPFSTSSIYTLIHYLERKWGIFFPRGGTGALVQALMRLFCELGGEVRLATPVERIEPVAQGGHRLSSCANDGEYFNAVVCNADLHHTYAHLLAKEPRAEPMRRRLARMDWSMSLFLVYFGTNRRFPAVTHHTVLFGPRYAGLLQDIFEGTHLPNDLSLYLHAPTVTDPSLAPEGCEAFYVLSPVPHLGRARVDWEAEKNSYAELILSYLDGYLPGLKQSVITRLIFTPNDFASELRAHEGSAFSLAPRLTQSAFFRPHNKDPRIPGLYLVGAGTHPGAGVPGVVSSAKATAKLVLEELRA